MTFHDAFRFLLDTFGSKSNIPVPTICRCIKSIFFYFCEKPTSNSGPQLDIKYISTVQHTLCNILYAF